PVDLGGLTPFRREVLAVTAGIPFGEVRSYTWVAEAVGRPNAPRAVGAALAANPVPLIIPCHRVVRRSGDPGGYAFGAATKVALLAAEGVTAFESVGQR
ncbi:MAG: cysteine methyltransferase, partial [Acidimicrobiia bacterium]